MRNFQKNMKNCFLRFWKIGVEKITKAMKLGKGTIAALDFKL